MAQAFGGWPSLSLCFSFPVPELGVPPSLRTLQGRAAMQLVPWGYAPRTASHLWRSSPALYHLLLLPALASFEFRAQSRPLPLDSGTDPRALPLRGRRICRHAGAYSPSPERTGSWHCLDGDASVEAALGARVVAEKQAQKSAPAQSVWRRATAQAVLAGAFLRLQRLDDAQAGGKAEVHATVIR